jgi:hypothetical protein
VVAVSLGLHCKKRLSVSLSQAGMSLTNLSLAGNKFNNSRPGIVWLVTFRLGPGKTISFLTV